MCPCACDVGEPNVCCCCICPGVKGGDGEPAEPEEAEATGLPFELKAFKVKRLGVPGGPMFSGRGRPQLRMLQRARSGKFRLLQDGQTQSPGLGGRVASELRPEKDDGDREWTADGAAETLGDGV
jgi:hypothetical protein